MQTTSGQTFLGYEGVMTKVLGLILKACYNTRQLKHFNAARRVTCVFKTVLRYLTPRPKQEV